MARIIKTEFRGDYRIYVEFQDGASGIVDIKKEFGDDHRQIVRDVLDERMFKTMKIDAGGLCWANEVDVCPDYLYGLIAGKKWPKIQVA